MLDIVKLRKYNSLVKHSSKEGYPILDSKHYPSMSSEWYNSIFTYNKSTEKLLPSLDVYVTKLIITYFNMFSLKLETGTMTRHSRMWKRRLKTNRILVSKPSFKHTNDKVIITIYVYNRQLMNFTRKLTKVKNSILNNLFKTKKVHRINLSTRIKNLINTFSNVKRLDENNSYINFNTNKLILLRFVKKMLKRIKIFLRLKRIIFSNKSKFNSIHISPLKKSFEEIYGKKVEFNIISLQSYHLNSDIMAQLLAIKLKNRKNNLLRVIKRTLSNIKLPFTSVLQYKQRIVRNKYRQNFIINKNLNNFLPKTLVSIITNNTRKFYLKKQNDTLNSVLELYYPNEYIVNDDIKNYSKEQMIINSINNKVVTGVRIEVSGRLTKRLTASRSLHGVRQIGTIKNINSSYKEISTVLLRGNMKSNLQFTKSSNKTRIGSFGVKGWISST